MAATLELQSYGCNFKTAILWLELQNCNLIMTATLKLQSYGSTFNTAILWQQL